MYRLFHRGACRRPSAVCSAAFPLSTGARQRPLWIAIGLWLGISSMVAAGEKWYVGAKYRESDLVSLDRIDHAPWTTLLRKYVNDRGEVDYGSWKHSSSDLQLLDRYLKRLSLGDPTAQASRAARLAFWINAYNATTIRGILREYPTTSIRNHTAKLFGYNIWKDLILIVGRRPYSLEDIEHRVLRPMKDDRIHFAIVCASISCPRLRNEAYTARDLDAQLNDNARDFFSNSRNFRYDAGANRVYLSSILKWFAEDFGSSDQAVLRAISRHLPRETAQAIQARRPSIVYLEYNWGINEQRPTRNARR